MKTSDQTASPAQAEMMADVFLGTANNLLEVGGGFFVKIKTSNEVREYDELVQIVEEQNERNVRLLKLDDSDRAMIKPLLAEVLKTKGMVLSPEQQLLIAVFSILIKKAQMVMQIRTENKLLEERMRQIIREERDGVPFEEPELEAEEEPSEFVRMFEAALMEKAQQEQEEEKTAVEELEQEDEKQSEELAPNADLATSPKMKTGSESDSPTTDTEMKGDTPTAESSDTEWQFTEEEFAAVQAEVAELSRLRDIELARRAAEGEDQPEDQNEPETASEAPKAARKETRSERRRREREERKKGSASST